MNTITIRNLLLGALSWLIPFAISVLFFDPAGQLRIAQPLFKSLMVVIGSGIGTLLLVIAFRRTAATLGNGVALGVFWLALNLVLDLAVLVAAMGMPLGLYLQDIGLRYLMLPIVAAGMGAVGEAAARA